MALTCGELAGELTRRYGKGSYHAAALYRGIFRQGCTTWEEVPGLRDSPVLLRRLTADVYLPDCRIAAVQSEAGVVKFASRLGDGQIIESVIIPAAGRTTLCLSSQVGCRMGCRFCATGKGGFVRDLRVEEIVWQVLAARFSLGRRVDNLVFMGMGEPLDNFDHVIQALRVLSDQRGLNIAYRHITLSTAGHVEGLARLKAFDLPRLRLAVSLNTADEALRSALMPINRRYPLDRLKAELRAFPLGKGGVILIEYVLLAGINDHLEDALALARFLEGLPMRVNVIAYNPGPQKEFCSPSPEVLRRFCAWLAQEGVFVRARVSRGQGIMAACGQLGASLGRTPLQGDNQGGGAR